MRVPDVLRKSDAAISLESSNAKYITRINAFALRSSIVEVCLGAHRFTSLRGNSRELHREDSELRIIQSR